MASYKDIIFVLALYSAIEVQSLADLTDGIDIPLSKSLGLSLKRSPSWNLEDTKISKEYQEMLKASREMQNKADEEEAKLENVVGKERAELLKMGMIDRRRSISRVSSPFGRRRVRSKRTRRERLNSQSLRSHQQHIRHPGQEYKLIEDSLQMRFV